MYVSKGHFFFTTHSCGNDKEGKEEKVAMPLGTAYSRDTPEVLYIISPPCSFSNFKELVAKRNTETWSEK